MTDNIRSANSGIPEENYNRIFGKKKVIRWVCNNCHTNFECEIQMFEKPSEEPLHPKLTKRCKPKWKNKGFAKKFR